MEGLMQEHPLVVTGIIDYAAKFHAETGITSHTVEGPVVFHSYADIRRRARCCALALRDLGVGPGDRVGTLAWNTHRHVEAWYGIMGLGAVCHTINPRLFAKDIAYIADHGGASVLLVEQSFAPLIAAVAAQCPCLHTIVYLSDACIPPSPPPLPRMTTLNYESLLLSASAREPSFSWTPVPESAACGLCYTSGTTGLPKGVLYSHRSNYLHALVVVQPDSLRLGSDSTILAVVPMFHANSWGIAFAAPLTGANLVLPGPWLGGSDVARLLIDARATHAAGVPTVWLGLQQHLQASKQRLPDLEIMVVGGAACPRALLQYFQDEHGCDVRQMWGMTELSPCGSVGTPKGVDRHASADDRTERRCTQGRPFALCDWRIVDDDGRELRRDGRQAGRLQVRGPATLSRYYREDAVATDADGWFDTGDVATLDAHGYMRITDRSKDVIKSGGEWISSIQVENAAVGHPDVAEAAVIAVPHPKWNERPLLIVVLNQGRKPDKQSILAHVATQVAKWWVPEDVVFVAEIPHTATGKIYKLQLRKQLGGLQPGDASPASKL